MDCPRCDGRLDTYAVETTGQTAVVCDACGFAGVAASHRPEESDPESWDRAIRRFERTEGTEDWTTETGRADGVSLPAGDSGPDIDPEALEESVAVAAALEETDDTTGLLADDTPEEPTADAGDQSADDAGESTADDTSKDSTADADEQSADDMVEDPTADADDG